MSRWQKSDNCTVCEDSYCLKHKNTARGITVACRRSFFAKKTVAFLLTATLVFGAFTGLFNTLSAEAKAVMRSEESVVDTDDFRFLNAQVTRNESTFTFTANESAQQINVYPTLADATPIAFSDLKGNVSISKSGTLYAKSDATATATINEKEYTIVFVFSQQQKSIDELLRTANTIVSVEGTTITLSPAQNAQQINVYPTLADGTALTFTDLTGGAKISKSGTLYAKSDATANVSVFGTDYKMIFSLSDGNSPSDTPSETTDLYKKYYVKDAKEHHISDLSEEATAYGDYYINADGDLVQSSANHVKKYDLSEYIPTSITCQSRSKSWYSYAFYSSTDTFDSSTLISGGKADAIKTDTVFAIDSIPDGAVTMLAVQYSTEIWSASGYDLTDGASYESVNEAIEQWKKDNNPDAVIYTTEETPTHIYRVGEGRTYADLISAVKQWENDGKPCATIYVDSGVYITQDDPEGEVNPLTVKGSANKLTIIGEDKDTTIVKSTTGKYIHAAINVQGGNVEIKNITFIANHQDNPDFVYLDPDRKADNKSPNSAYAVHCDGGSTAGVVPGIIKFENCNMFSWQSCGLGCGTVENGHIIVKDCDIRSYVPGTATDEGNAEGTAEEQEAHAIYVHGTRGAVVYHTKSANANSSNESFTLINSNVYIMGGTKVVSITNNSAQDFKLLTFIDNTFCNDIEKCNTVNIPKNVYLSGLSKGNNIAAVNSDGKGYCLRIE